MYIYEPCLFLCDLNVNNLPNSLTFKKKFIHLRKIFFNYIMKKQKSCLVALAMLASASAFADNAESLVFYGVQGKADNAVELTNFRKITFGENGFNVLSQDGSTLQLNYGDVRSIKFKDLVNGIQSVTNGNASEMMLHFDGQYVWADGANGQQGAVYGINGQQLLGARLNGTRISVESLPKGVYVFKAGGKSIKFAK